MKKFFSFTGEKKEVIFCPVCGAELINDFCSVCNKYISPEKANERLKEKYPHIKKCEKCKSRKITFVTEEEKNPVPKNFLDKIAITIIHKHDEKYPQEMPPYREIAKCNKCGHKWYVDGYKDNNKTMVLLRKCFLIAIAALAFIMIIVIGSIFENEDSDATDFENTTSQISQTNTSETTDSYHNTTETPSTEDIVTTVETTTIEETTESTTVFTTTETTTNETTTRKGRTVYVTPYGKKYHFSAGCAGSNAMDRDYNDVKDIYDPCKKCAYLNINSE